MGVISISIPDELLEIFDNFLEEHQFSSRSDGIRSAIQAFVSLTEEYDALEGERAFMCIYIMNDKPEVWERFENLLDEFNTLVKNVSSYKRGDRRIYSVFSIGYVGDVLKMHNQLSSLKIVSMSYLNHIL